MGRPTKNDVDSGIQNWHQKIDDNDEAILNAPFPIHEHTGDETDLQSTFAAAAYDRCFVWVDHTTLGWTLYWSDGTNWIPYSDYKRDLNGLSATTTQAIGDAFVRFTGTGTLDYDFLAAASWAGRTVEIRNDMTSGTLNLDPNGTEQINGGGAGTPLVLAIGSTARVYSDGTTLYASVAL